MDFDHSLPGTSSTVANFLPSSSTAQIPNEELEQKFTKNLKTGKAATLKNDQLGHSEEVLHRKMTALQHEERALLSLITRLRSHQRTLQLEKVRLDKFYEESIKKEMLGADEDKKEGGRKYYD